MPPLRSQIARLRGKIRRLSLAYGLAWLAIASLGGILVLGTADYLLRFEDRGVRILATLTLLGVLVWTVYRRLWPAVSMRISDVAIARRVERRFPQFADRLSSAIDFLDQPEDEPIAGSAKLRRAVIAQTTADVEGLRWSDVLDIRPAGRACAVALALGCIGAVVAFLNPLAALTAIERLALPGRDLPWPREHYLAFKTPLTRVAVGQDFEVELIDHSGQPPEDARIAYRSLIDGQPAEEEYEKPIKIGDVLVARKENVLRPFEYRAVGGDDTGMDWIRVELVEPPAVAAIAITLHPPEYSGLPATSSERRIEALRGTRVELAGKTTRRTAAAALVQEDGTSVPLRVTQDGFGFELSATDAEPWVIDKSEKYWIELADRDQLVGGREDRWDVRAIADEPPRVSLERPVGTLYITPSAVAPIVAQVRDDLAIRDIALHFLRSDNSDAGEQTIEIYRRPESAPTAVSRSSSAAALGESREIEYDWDLGPLALSPGVQLTMTASASDYRPQMGTSQAVRIIVLTPREFEDRIAARESAILAEIARVLKMQQETRTGTQALLAQATRAGEFRKQDADASHTNELGQRQVRRSLISPSEGVLAQATALVDELSANRVDNPEMIRRVEQIADEIRRLNVEELASIEHELVSVVKNSQLVFEDPSTAAKEIVARIASSLTTAVAAQSGVIASLEKLLDELAEWTDYRAIAREVAEIQMEQRELRKRTQAVQPATLGRDYKDLTPQQQTDLANIASVQSELARRFDRLQQRMEQMKEKIRQSAPLAADSLADAVELARRQTIGSDMRDGARFVEGNRLGQSIERQGSVDAKLDELLNILSNRGGQGLSQLVKKLRAAEDRLMSLRQEQQGLRKKIREAHEGLERATDSQEKEKLRAELARLMQEQRKLEDEIKRFGRELARLRAQEAADRTAAAGGKMQAGSQSGDSGDSGRAADLADEAARDLDEAQRRLAERRRQAEQDLANEQLATVEHALEGLLVREQSALAETTRLHALRDSQGELRPEQAASVKDLARNQQQLKLAADSIAEKLTAAEVFQLGVRSSAEQMQRASDRLSQGDTGDDAQRAEQQALVRLRQLLQALKEGQSVGAEDPKQPGESNPGNEGARNNRPPPMVHSVTEIKLLTVMQEDVNRRTIELQERIGGRAATGAEAGELASLAQEQGSIAELVAKMTARTKAEKP